MVIPDCARNAGVGAIEILRQELEFEGLEEPFRNQGNGSVLLRVSGRLRLKASLVPRGHEAHAVRVETKPSLLSKFLGHVEYVDDFSGLQRPLDNTRRESCHPPILQ